MSRTRVSWNLLHHPQDQRDPPAHQDPYLKLCNGFKKNHSCIPCMGLSHYNELVLVLGVEHSCCAPSLHPSCLQMFFPLGMQRVLSFFVTSLEATHCFSIFTWLGILFQLSVTLSLCWRKSFSWSSNWRLGEPSADAELFSWKKKIHIIVKQIRRNRTGIF